MQEAQTEPCPACGSILDISGAPIFAERTCPVCATPIHVRRKFGHYELMSMVGSGGQGMVYRAVDNNLNRLVALKLLRTEFSEDPDFVAQFEHEAKLTASINHPNVVRVYSFGADEGHVYLAMELVDNGTMDDLMEKLGRIPEARALQIGIEVAQGLRAGNEMGLVHRDVKPGNILFAADGTAKVVDYGLAMFFEQAAMATGEIWGTPYYLSPERLNKVAEDFRSDIYSLGATLFHAIAGRPPFEAEDASHVALKHLRSQAVSLQTFAPGICNATSYVINRTLAKSPDDRQQSYDEFIEQLQFAREEALAKARGGAMQQKSRLVLDDKESTKTASWITLATIAVLVVGLVVGGLLVARALRGDKEGQQQPVTTAPADLASYGPGWSAARALLLGGQFIRAEQAFGDLANQHPAGSTERALAQVHAALSSQFGGRQNEAVSTLQELGSGTQISKFFSDEVAPKLRGTARVPAEVSRNFNSRTYEGLGTLFLALKNYEHGHFDDAGALLRQYAAYAPDPAWTWVASYKELSRPLQNQLDAYTLAANAWAAARNARERDEAFARIQEVPKLLSPTSKIRPLVQTLLAQAEKKRAEDIAARMKANYAFRAKVQASGADKDDVPANAVDGDNRTRWADKTEGEKWLAVDLGAPKEINRWVLKSAVNPSDKWDANITEVTLQRSDDGRTWQDVDKVTGNTLEVIDRVVAPFTARHVRVFSTKGGSKAGDHGFRVAEFEVGKADEQTRAEYDLNQPFAMRFSMESELQLSPIGDPFVQGSASFDAKTGKYTIKGAGADIWGTADHFHFAWQKLEGDGEIVARFTNLQRVHEWTKAGVMFRSGLHKEASFGISACASDGKVQFAKRATNAEPATSTNLNSLPLPRWLKIQRQGSTLIGFESADGQKWNEISRATIQELPPSAYVGIAVCSHIPGQLAEAQVDNVKITKK